MKSVIRTAIHSFIEPTGWFTYNRGTQNGVLYQTVEDICNSSSTIFKTQETIIIKMENQFSGVFFQPVGKPVSSTNHTSCSVGPRSHVCYPSIRRVNHNLDFLFLQVNCNIHSKKTTCMLPCGNTLYVIATAINLFRASTNVGFLCNTTTGSNVLNGPNLMNFYASTQILHNLFIS